MRHPALLLATFTVLTAGSLANAENLTSEDSPDGLLGLSLEELMTVEVESVSSASRYTQSLVDAPTFTSIITNEQIRRFGYRTLADVYRSLGGFFTTFDRSYSYTGVRGFGRPGDYDTRILVMIDGHRLNEDLYDSTDTLRNFPIDLELVDRIEVVRGPGSSLYGTNAFFAVVNLITKKGAAFNAVEGGVSAARYDDYQGRARVGFPLGGEGSALLALSRGDSHGHPTLFFPEFDDPATNNGIARNRDGDHYQKLFTDLRYEGFSFQAAYSARHKDVPTASFGTAFNPDPEQNVKDSRAYLVGSYNWSVLEKTAVNFRAAYDWYEYRAAYPYSAEDPNDPALTIPNNDFGRAERWSYDATVTSSLSSNNTLIAGVEYRDAFNLDQENSDEGAEDSFIFQHNDAQSWAVFAQDQFRIGSRINAYLGFRYDDYDTSGGQASPRAGLVVVPWTNTAVKLLYGEAFRTPNAYEMNYDDAQDVYAANPDLSPEEIQTTSLIIERYFSDALRASVTGYFYDIDNLIDQQVLQETGELQFQNGAGARATGVEAEVEGRWKDGWYARASYAFGETEQKMSGAILTNSPRHLVKLAATAPLIPERLFWSPELLYVSSRLNHAGARIPDYTVLNVTLSYEELVPGLTLALSAYNLLDRRYRDPVNADHVQTSLEQDGRVFRLTATYRYDLPQ